MDVVIPEILLFTNENMVSLNSRKNARRREKVVKGKNIYSQRGDKGIKIDKWNKKLKEVMR